MQRRAVTKNAAFAVFTTGYTLDYRGYPHLKTQLGRKEFFMDATNKRYRKLYICLEEFQDENHEFYATSILRTFASSLVDDERVLLPELVDFFYLEAMENVVPSALKNLSGIFLALQDSELNVTAISIADVAWIAETLTKISHIQSEIEVCLNHISAYELNKNTPAASVNRLKLLKYHLQNQASFITMIVKRFSELLGMYNK